MLAAFATSQTGKMYGHVCERYGVDPGEILEDDVLAFNLRAAIALATLPEIEPEQSEGFTNPDLYEQMKASRGQ